MIMLCQEHIKWGGGRNPLSPILGQGVNPFLSRFIYRMIPMGDSAHPLL